MATKYQVFVSSTYEDLKDQRDVVIKAILEMGHIPVGMEMFSAADEQQWQIIARHIEESDYYCVVVAHRYGSIAETVSYTQKEYEYAISMGIPVLGFVIDSSVSWPAKMVDQGDNAQRLNDFKQLVKGKPVSFWKNTEDLYGKVSIALTKQMTANPRDGWVRASALAGPQVTVELSRLSAENASLRKELDLMSDRMEADKTAEMRSVLADLQKNTTNVSYKYSSRDTEWSSVKVSLLDIFEVLAPALVTEVGLDAAAKTLAMEVREDRDQRWWIVAKNQLQTRFTDLMAFELIEPSKRKHAVSDTEEYWTLTTFGHEVLKFFRRSMMKTVEPESETDSSDDATDSAQVDSVERPQKVGKRPVKKASSSGVTPARKRSAARKQSRPEKAAAKKASSSDGARGQ